MWGQSNEETLMAGFGHNSASYGEQLRAEVEVVLSDDHETTFHYAQWHVNDYIAGTAGMELQYEGAYIRFLMRLYQRGKPLPDNDGFMATLMGLSTRVWKRVKTMLIDFGKIIARNGCLTNSRFEKERRDRAETIRKQSEAARLRWEKQRAEKTGLTEVSPKFAGSLDETSAKLPGNAGEKPNDFNEAAVTGHMLTNIQYPIDIPPIVPQGGDESVKRRRSPVPETYTEDFEAFWSICPRKTGKGAAFKLWQKLTMDQRRKAYRVMKRDRAALAAKGDYCPHVSTWLSQWRFDDDPAVELAPEERRPDHIPEFIWERAQAAKREAAAR